MNSSNGSCRSRALAESLGKTLEFYTRSTWARRHLERGIADFTFGNPHEMPLAGVVDALRDWSTPLHRSWFAYKTNEAHAQAAAATSLRRWTGVPFEPADIALTNGGAAALSIGLKALADPGDEVIFSLPPWFCYRALILEAGLAPSPVAIDAASFDLDLEAIEAAITPRTRVLLVNTPHNPTGRIYPPETLGQLADLLDDASRRIGRTIFLLSDEPYNRLVFDDRRFHSPAAYYPHTLVAYSYGKVLMTPGQRIGYLAIAPGMPNREQFRERIMATQIAAGWAFPNALLQHALPDLEQLSISVAHLQRKRDRMYGALRTIGYDVHLPEAAFFLLSKSPWPDDGAFTELLATHDIFVMPGSVFELPGYFRISLTASDDMIERSLPGFASAWEQGSGSGNSSRLRQALDGGISMEAGKARLAGDDGEVR